MIITKTPVRISMGGGGTDLPFFYPKHEGELVTATIDKYIYITVSERKFHNNFRISYSKTELTENVDSIQNTRARAALKFLGIKKPLEITVISDIPGESGLGGSSSFLIGLLKALHQYLKEDISSVKLAEEAAKIEIEILGEPIGKQDQYAAAIGGINHLKINRKGSVFVSPLNISFETLRDLEMNLHMFFTGITRSASGILKNQAESIKNDESKLEYMKHIKEIGIDSRKSLERGDTKKFGRLLNVHWELKKKTSKKMTDPKIDEWYNIAIKNGALGGKIMGAGGGGFFIFYCDKSQLEFIKTMELLGLGYVPFKFDHDGGKIIADIK